MFKTSNQYKMSKLFKLFSFKLSYVVLGVFFLSVIFPVASRAQNGNQPTFNHMALCAKDLRKTAAFYKTVLQLQVIPNPFHDTTHVWFKIGNGLALHVIHGDCPLTDHNIAIHLCFAVPSLAAFMKHLDDLQVTYGDWGGNPKKVQTRADGVKQIYFQDPDGFWIEVNDAK
jgi:lactoylglutathione lyase